MSRLGGEIAAARFKQSSQLRLPLKRSKRTIDRELNVLLLSRLFELEIRIETVECDLFHLAAKADDIHEELWTKKLTTSPAGVGPFAVGPLVREVEIGAAVFQIREFGPAELFTSLRPALNDQNLADFDKLPVSRRLRNRNERPERDRRATRSKLGRAITYQRIRVDTSHVAARWLEIPLSRREAGGFVLEPALEIHSGGPTVNSIATGRSGQHKCVPAGISLDAGHFDLCALGNGLDVADAFARQNVVTCLVTFLLQLLITDDRLARFDDKGFVHVALVVHRNTAILSAFCPYGIPHTASRSKINA